VQQLTAKDVTLLKMLVSKFSYLLFSNLTPKTKPQTANMWRLLLLLKANHLKQSF
jgi:hypothetical protein